MTTDRYVWLAAHPAAGRPSLCGCGQELDGGTRQHCPRCGAALASDAGDPATQANIV